MNKKYKITLKSFFGHLKVVNKHRFKVFLLCCKAGIPFQGLVHDLSKYSPTEFLEGAKYFQGDYSPIVNCKRDKGYSEAWLHHKGRNKHHYEYWYDYVAYVKAPPMPYKYFVELVCDCLAAGMTYQGKKWSKGYQLTYWNKTKEKAIMDDRMKKLLTKIYTDISKEGVNKVIKKDNLKKLYAEYMA